MRLYYQRIPSIVITLTCPLLLVFSMHAGTPICLSESACTMPGCTDPLAVNYNPDADTDDGSCCYEHYVTFTATFVSAGTFNMLPDLTWNLSPYGSPDIIATGPITGNTTVFSCCVPNGCFVISITDFRLGSVWEITASGIDDSYIDHNFNYEFGHKYFKFSTIGAVGCNNPEATNYVPTGSGCNSARCFFPDCTDPLACNYNRFATVDNGSCIYPQGNYHVEILPDYAPPFQVHYSIQKDGVVVVPGHGMTVFSKESFCLEPGCYTITLSNSFCGNAINSQVCESIHVLVNGIELLYFHGVAGQSITKTFCIIGGCADPLSCNYAPDATVPEPCVYPGCTNPQSCNYNPEAACDDGSCLLGDPLTVRITNSNASPAVINYSFSSTPDGPAILSGSAIAMAGQQELVTCVSPGCYYLTISGVGTGDNWQLGTLQNGNVFVALQNTTSSGNTNTSNANVCYLFGCTDIGACNYNGFASVDDGSCKYNCTMCSTLEMYDQGNEALNGTKVNVYDNFMQLVQTYTSYKVDEDYPGICTDEFGCYFIEFIPPQTTATPILWSMTLGGNTFTGTGNGIYGFSPSGILGCTEEHASNYNVNASCDDGSCILPGCTFIHACNYNPLANVDDGSCGIAGCMDPAACNFNAQAVCNAPCIFDGMEVAVTITNPGAPDMIELLFQEPASGVLIEAALIQVNGSATYYTCLSKGCFVISALGIPVDGPYVDVSINGHYAGNVGLGGLVCPEFGCNDPLACNFDPEAMVSLNNCGYAGCTDDTACNFNPLACSDDGSCNHDDAILELVFQLDQPKFLSVFIVDSEGSVLLDVNRTIYDGESLRLCMPPVCFTYYINNLGPFDLFEEFVNGQSNGVTLGAAQIEFGYCITGGCKDPSACNYDPTALASDGSCSYPGCTNPLAVNYDASAECDDGSCLIGGCTDDAACNYSSAAQVDNGTCDYSCICPGDYDNNGAVNTTDLLLLMSSFGCVSNCSPFDVDGNGVVNTSDLLVFMSLFGTFCG